MKRKSFLCKKKTKSSKCLTVNYRSVKVLLEPVVERPDVVAEGLELRNDEIVAKDLGDEGKISREHVLELIKVQADGLQGLGRLRLVLLQATDDGGQTVVGSGTDSSAADFL